ncbi:uncharacterized protein LOC117103123 [Anneissia japonica]|uniref:uncharacterized protein LOC117103123 n=1 Tax=Anneissia japonica TaxID=1529436 RepID=UPI00142590AD|nr:uncharacterized protein LOC117103123 [Anneissia japonica]
MKGLAIIILLASCLLHMCVGQYLDIDSVTVSSPSYLSEGMSNSATFSITFTTYNGADSIIEGDMDATRYTLKTYISNDGESETAASNATLTSSMIATDLTDDVSNTWSAVSTTIDLTNVVCSNNTYVYFCAEIEPSPGATWGPGVDYSGNATCADLVCRYEVDVGITDLEITNPDDGLTVGGGQAIDFDVTIMIHNSSNDVGGYNVWAINAYLSTYSTGVTKATESDATLSFAQRTYSLSAGSSVTFETVAVTLDLTNLDCNDGYYFCAEVKPHSSGYWYVADSGNLDEFTCISFTCNSATSVTVSALVFLLSFSVLSL